MNIRTRTILMAGALIAAAATAGAQAADQDAFFQRQREITDGYYPQYNVKPTARMSKPATLHQAQEDEWLNRERAMGSGVVAPVPFPVPGTAPAATASASSTQTAQNQWWTEERALDDGHVWPVPSASTSGSFASVNGR
jgi:hypothetical protein